MLSEKDLSEKITIDMQLPFSKISPKFIDEIKLLEPFGKGNTKPVFAEKNLVIREREGSWTQQRCIENASGKCRACHIGCGLFW